MSEIEKMMQNAGIKKEVIPCPAKYYGYDCTRNNWDDEDCSCDIEGYPPFTAEKQIELIKWLIVHSPSTCLEDEIIVCAFEDSLTNIINTMWQDLTSEEKRQIKEILK